MERKCNTLISQVPLTKAPPIIKLSEMFQLYQLDSIRDTFCDQHNIPDYFSDDKCDIVISCSEPAIINGYEMYVHKGTISICDCCDTHHTYHYVAYTTMTPLGDSICLMAFDNAEKSNTHIVEETAYQRALEYIEEYYNEI